jgi:two-component system sensor histidine kinase UhpB
MERYRNLVESSPDGVVVVADGQIAYANPAALDLFGALTPDHLRGRPLLDRFHQDSHAAVRHHLSRWEAGQAAQALDAAIVRFDGTTRNVSIGGARLTGEGERTVQMILRDFSERIREERALRESEERLALAVAGAQEGVWDWNLETDDCTYSTRWKQMLGYAEHEIEPRISAWERLVHPDDRRRADLAHDSVARGERETYEAEFRLRHKEGQYVHVLSRGFPVRREPGGRVVRIVGTHFDLTERKRAEAERARTELLARLVFAQEDERRRIAREMHDQFGEQLTALSQRIRMLQSAVGDQQPWRGHVDALEAIGHQLDRDVDQLVWELRPTALDDLGLRAALENYVRNWSSRTGVAATLHMSGLLDDRLPSHAETALYRIAQEALTNVAKHARATAVEVILERRRDHVMLIIEDDGVGFDSAAIEAAGGGFGLVGMKERAGLVGASLEIESSADQGTTVFVRMDAGGPAGAPDQV